MLIGAEIGAELVLVQDLGHFGQNRYPSKYSSRPKVNFEQSCRHFKNKYYKESNDVFRRFAVTRRTTKLG